MYDSLLGTSAALHLDVFEQPAGGSGYADLKETMGNKKPETDVGVGFTPTRGRG